MSKPVVVIGGGGHARVVIDLLRRLDIEIGGVCDDKLEIGSHTADGIEVICHDRDLPARVSPQSYDLAHGIGSLPGNDLRRTLYDRFSQLGFAFRTMIHPDAVVAANVTLGEGVQVMAGAVVQSGADIGDNCIVNTRASVDHDCRIDHHCHVAPGAVLGGGVVLERDVHVGSGAIVIQCIEIGAGTTVGAGAIVTANVPAHRIVYPARSTVATLESKQHES